MVMVYFVKGDFLMRQFNLVGIIVFIWVLIANVSSAPGLDDQEVSWKEQAKSQGLSPQDIAQLEKDKILITNVAYKQIFTAYKSNLPVFITSDSLLNAYHVLFEASFKQFEMEKAKQLPGLLSHMVENLGHLEGVLQCDPEVMVNANKRSQLVIGIALKLIDDSFSFKDKELNAILNLEIENILEAKEVEMPEWLGDSAFSFYALDYSRYKPRGFYTQNEELSRYFRAISWLQSIPFRSNIDEEFASFLMISSSILVDGKNEPYTFAKYREVESNQPADPFGGYSGRPDRPELHDQFRDFFSSYESLIGLFHGPNLISVAYCIDDIRFDQSDLNTIREQVQQELGIPDPELLVNDLNRFPPSEQELLQRIDYHVISSYNSPSSILFDRTMNIIHSGRAYPQGVEVAAALGSNFACQYLLETKKVKVLKMVEYSKPLFDRYGLYGEYLKLLKTLVDAPEHDAPVLFGSEAWQRKSCQTVLASWAQQKHTFALHDTKAVYFRSMMGIDPVPKGFIEPDPMFFSQMKTLAQTAKEKFNGNKSSGKQSDTPLDRIKELRQRLKEKELINDEPMTMVLDLGYGEYFLFGSIPIADAYNTLRMTPYSNEDAFCSGLSKLFIDDLQNRKMIDLYKIENEDSRKKDLPDFDSQWSSLMTLCDKLELISHKQLRGVDLTFEDNQFIVNYRGYLAGMMQYFGQSSLNPKDDAPKIVDVFSNYEVGCHLQVGVSRARQIYVLYPWKGKEYLSLGGIMPYYEFPSRTRLTDDEWHKMLDSQQRPDIPEWVRPIVSGGELVAPQMIIGGY